MRFSGRGFLPRPGYWPPEREDGPREDGADDPWRKEGSQSDLKPLRMMEIDSWTAMRDWHPVLGLHVSHPVFHLAFDLKCSFIALVVSHSSYRDSVLHPVDRA